MTGSRLADSASNYLQQHADDPVDWRPWGDEAFAEAARRDLPVMLSCGYAACHWCHVMQRESFRDPETAALINERFVAVKVDREERPDVDALYMDYLTATSGSGGWPMTVFLTPARVPVFGGTYFPKRAPVGGVSFADVLHSVDEAWRTGRDRLTETEARSLEFLRSQAAPKHHEKLDRAALDASAEYVALYSDPVSGGFGASPKFPQWPLFEFLIAYHAVVPDPEIDWVVSHGLLSIVRGGIYDQAGGGVMRYAIDSDWLVPHFEKMLYDQAGLLRAYLHGWQVTGNPDYLGVVNGIVTYVTRDLTAPEGGVYAAEDADSEGVEGKFYTWTPDQVTDAAGSGPEPGAVASAALDWFDVTSEGNFEGATILRRPVGGPLAGPDHVEEARRRMLAARSTRVRPGLDGKVLTEWNAMYASALAETAAATGRTDWAMSAVGTAEFLCANLVDDQGRWLRSWQRNGGARHLAYAADHAWLVDCFTRLAELTGRAVWTERAIATADALIARFADVGGGGFFTTADDAEQLIVRTKDVFDGATPSANAVAALALARLGALTGDATYIEHARSVVDLVGELLVRHPTAFAHTVLTADLLARGTTEVVVAGDRPDLLAEVRSSWRPDAVVAWGEPTASPLWADRQPGFAYVCQDYSCRLPAADVAVLAEQLSGPRA